MTTVLLADDHQLLRQALRRALEDAGLHVVGEAADGDEAVRLAGQLEPDVVVMDVTMPVLDGVEATRRVHHDRAETRIVVLTMHSEQALLARAVDAGACAFLTKDASMQDVVRTVQQAADGEVLLSPELAASMLGELRGPHEPHEPGPAGPPSSPLTRREEEILQLVADGHSTTEVARRLFISAKTVKNHLASIYEKLDARDRTQAVLSGVRIGIIQLR
ncbi:MAG: response regulator transcription factor [Acidimicrobiia bacterium]|nr:response regulator transcription factor [Acidimicrobiia bacterium]